MKTGREENDYLPELFLIVCHKQLFSGVNKYQSCFTEANNTAVMWEGFSEKKFMLQVYLRIFEMS